MPSISFSECHAHHIYLGMSILLYHEKNLYEALYTQGYRDQLLYFAAHVHRVITPHTQCEQGKVISVGVRVSVYNYIYICVRTNFF